MNESNVVTDYSPSEYAAKIVNVLGTTSGVTARTALRIADALIEHRITCEALSWERPVEVQP
jgi:hypothetical protein